ncbi:MAG: hypothetical protein K0R12_712 [Gammaproteobacteria bacterium]|jgi:BMFP domain-containing protein YqiC|nr:hypothetical protein [Gammaproteobacteria bacterium]
MISSTIFEDIVQKLSHSVPESVTLLRSDVEKNIRSILESGIAKLDLVTRKEFDAQVGVLQRTREQVAALEARIKILEDLLSK